VATPTAYTASWRCATTQTINPKIKTKRLPWWLESGSIPLDLLIWLPFSTPVSVPHSPSLISCMILRMHECCPITDESNTYSVIMQAVTASSSWNLFAFAGVVCKSCHSIHNQPVAYHQAYFYSNRTLCCYFSFSFPFLLCHMYLILSMPYQYATLVKGNHSIFITICVLMVFEMFLKIRSVWCVSVCTNTSLHFLRAQRAQHTNKVPLIFHTTCWQQQKRKICAVVPNFTLNSPRISCLIWCSIHWTDYPNTLLQGRFWTCITCMYNDAEVRQQQRTREDNQDKSGMDGKKSRQGTMKQFSDKWSKIRARVWDRSWNSETQWWYVARGVNQFRPSTSTLVSASEMTALFYKSLITMRRGSGIAIHHSLTT